MAISDATAEPPMSESDARYYVETRFGHNEGWRSSTGQVNYLALFDRLISQGLTPFSAAALLETAFFAAANEYGG